MPPFDVYRAGGEPSSPAPGLFESDPLARRSRGRYLADPKLAEAINLAICVGQPLLVTGEPGCGKTELAWSVAEQLELGEPLTFYTRSTSRAQDLLYRFDAVRRFHDIQSHDDRARDPLNYVQYEALGRAIVDGRPRVVLVDEIDKAPRDFPNDLLNELDKMEFTVWELPEETRTRSSTIRPVTIITSNSERQLPLPFLRRCVFHRIDFPDEAQLVRIIRERLGGEDLDGELVRAAVDRFQEVREVKGLSKPPATGEVLTWTSALHAQGITVAALTQASLGELPLWQALVKDHGDLLRLIEAA